jgi:hypothetical protein
MAVTRVQKRRRPRRRWNRSTTPEMVGWLPTSLLLCLEVSLSELEIILQRAIEKSFAKIAEIVEVEGRAVAIGLRLQSTQGLVYRRSSRFVTVEEGEEGDQTEQRGLELR